MKELIVGQIYTCIGKGGKYRLLGGSTGAGKSRGTVFCIYQDIETKQIFHRDMIDFNERMQLVEDFQ